MQLVKFKYFVQHVHDHEIIADLTQDQAIYWYFNNKWSDENEVEIKDEKLCLMLQKALDSGTTQAPTKSSDTYFPIKSLDSVVVCTYGARPQSDKKLRCEKALNKCLERAHKDYDAQHSEVTGLPNKKAYETALLSLIEDRSALSSQTVAELVTVSPASSISLIAIDIDHFKQINDTYGHPYGDIVLEMLARRLEGAAEQLTAIFENKVDFYCAHPSGEEFSIILCGTSSKIDDNKISDFIKDEIWKSPLPSDEEWDNLAKTRKPSDFDFPIPADRSVTISLGVSSIRNIPSGSDPKELATQLNQQADVALYRAKAGGRNTVRNFSDILEKHGRVMEHHPDTEIVTIDIGRNVAVTEGQEFIVYHPDFTGDSAFIFKDGRTERTLGMRPRKSCGRIEVFKVLTEISFCQMKNNELKNPFPEGSHLEAVPVGSIGHLINSTSDTPEFGASSLLKVNEIRSEAESIVKSKKRPFVCVTSLSNSDHIIRERGTAYVNQVLANLAKQLIKALPTDVSVGQINPTEIAVVSDAEKFESIKDIQFILDEMNSLSNGLVEINSGYYNVTDSQSKRGGNNSKLTPDNSLQYARYAALSLTNYVRNSIPFNESVAGDVIYAARKAHQPDTAIEDFRKLTELGVVSALMENQLGLALIENGKFWDEPKLILTSFERAVELDPSSPPYYFNHAMALYVHNDKLEAYRAFQSGLAVKDGINMLADVYLRPYAMAMAEAYLRSPSSVDYPSLIEALNNAKDKSPAIQVDVSAQDIMDMIVKIALPQSG